MDPISFIRWGPSATEVDTYYGWFFREHLGLDGDAPRREGSVFSVRFRRGDFRFYSEREHGPTSPEALSAFLVAGPGIQVYRLFYGV
jgi:hypothetical protein